MERVFHTWDEWECYPAGLYETKPPCGMTPQEAIEAYRAFLHDTVAFKAALARVLNEWPNSCEHYLTNVNMNRIAWLGQAAMCIASGVPANFRAGFNRLTKEEKRTANETALCALNKWLTQHGEPELTLSEAKSKTQMDLY